MLRPLEPDKIFYIPTKCPGSAFSGISACPDEERAFIAITGEWSFTSRTLSTMRACVGTAPGPRSVAVTSKFTIGET